MPTWERSKPRHAAFNCRFSWHYRKSGLYLAVYDLIGGVTSGGENKFTSSIEKVAEYFDANYETTRRVFKHLVKAGWLIRQTEAGRQGRGRVVYQYVPHDDWVKSHPGKCALREVLSWDGEADPIVGKIWAVFNGKIRLYEGHIKALRLVATDEEFLEKLRVEVKAAAEAKARGYYAGSASKSIFFRVLNYFKNRAEHQNTGSRQGSKNEPSQKVSV